MNRLIAFLSVALTTLVGAPSAIADEAVSFLPVYIPAREEAAALFRLQTLLAEYNRDIAKIPQDPLFTQLLDLSQKYGNLQTHMLEAFFQTTQNKQATSFYRRYASEHSLTAPAVQTTLMVMDRPAAPPVTDQQSPTHTLSSGQTAEWINLFSFGELRLFDGRLHSTFFDDNGWWRFTTQGDSSVVSFNCGGGTNAFIMIYRRHKMSLSDFVQTQVYDQFYRDKYQNWSITKLDSKSGVLATAGADAVYFGQGACIGIWDIKESTVALFLYSQAYGEGYEIQWMMNFSSPNVFYELPEQTWHHLAETLLLTWIE